MKAVPLKLLLPDGPAHLVPGSFEAGQPQYARDGIVLDVDVAIPPELDGRWFWHGSFLRLQTEPGECGLAIFTGTFPPPQCFEQARELERIRAELDAAPVRQAKAGKRTVAVRADVPIVAPPEPELAYELAQLAMEF
jgi:hypothetical protein